MQISEEKTISFSMNKKTMISAYIKMLHIIPSLSFITSKPAAPPACATLALAVKVQSPRLAKAIELVNCSKMILVEKLNKAYGT